MATDQSTPRDGQWRRGDNFHTLTHGMTNTPEWKAWRPMRDRCLNEGHSKYHRYGGRGITICARWLESFRNFHTDMGTRLSADYSLDREDNDGGYWCGRCPECVSLGRPANCRWIPSSDQSVNRHPVRALTSGGETLSLAEWSRRSGISTATITARLKRGWSEADAVSMPADATRGVGYRDYRNGKRRTARVKRKKQPPRTHGMRNAPEYRVWRGVKDRCLNPNCPKYPQYGGRGISTCVGIQDSFEQFFATVGRRPAKGLSLDRINGAKGYDCGSCPDCIARSAACNIRWADWKQQANNRSSNHVLTFGGLTLSIAEWARRVRISPATLLQRVQRGWTTEETLATLRRGQ